MGRDKRNERHQQQFTKWVYAHRLLPAWKALSFPARDAYFHLQVRCFADTKAANNNNGEVFRSLRDLSSDMGCSLKTAGAALADLQAKGWIFCTSQWQRGTDGKGKTAKFRLTMLPTEGEPATREPERWEEGKDFPVRVYKTYLPKPRRGRNSNFKNPEPTPPFGHKEPRPSRMRLKVVQS